MSNRPTASAEPVLNRTALTLEAHIEELRAELASITSRSERHQIEAELQAARVELAALQIA